MSYDNLTYYSSNFNRLFNDKAFILNLLAKIKTNLGRRLREPEKKYVIELLKNVDPVIFVGKNTQTILKVLSDRISEDIVKNPCADDDVDIHEMLKEQIGVSAENTISESQSTSNVDFTNQVTSIFANQIEVTSLLGSKSIADLQRVINPSLVKTTVSIMLDTRYRILDNDGTTYFKWVFNNNEITSQGTVNAIGNIRDITAIRIFPIKMPYNSNADNDYSRVTILIQEISAQSFISHENRRFHFIFGTSVDDRWINLEPESFNDGYFRFRTPITRLDTVTLSFGSPLESIVFDTDRMLASITSYSTVTTFTTTSPHNIETGDRVYVTNFTTANSNTDAVMVTAINKTNGHIATVTGTNSFTIDVNSSTIQVLGSGTVSVTNGSPVVIGTSTTFGISFNASDVIEISGIKYVVQSVQTQTQLTLTTDYTGTTAGLLTYSKNNILSDLRPTVYFGSKRIFFPMEIEYYAS